MTPRPVRVTVVEDRADDALLVERELRRAGFEPEIRVVEREPEFREALALQRPEIVLADYALPEFDGMSALRIVLASAPETPVIIVTGSLDEETAVECMKAGAADFVLKDRLVRLGPAVSAALERSRLRGEREDALAELRAREERLRQLTGRLAESEESERRRIARDLHDRVGQNLVALNLNVAMIRSRLPADSLERVAATLADVTSLVAATAREIRAVIADLHPSVLGDYGLLTALRWLASEHAGRSGVDVEAEGDELEPRLAPAVEAALFRIAQEAVTNCLRHCDARRVRVVLEGEPGTVRLRVADDGRGFDPGATLGSSSSGGFGLRSMRERAEAVGGSLTVRSEPGRGTTVRAEVPR